MSYLECLHVVVAYENLSLQYVDSMNYIWVRKWLSVFMFEGCDGRDRILFLVGFTDMW